LREKHDVRHAINELHNRPNDSMRMAVVGDRRPAN